MFVERCWRCLEQPAVTTTTDSEGRCYPVCDVCATEPFDGSHADGERVSDADLRRLLGESA